MVHPLIARGPFLWPRFPPTAPLAAYIVGLWPILHHNTKRSRPTGNEFSGVQAAFPSGRPVGRKNVFTCTMIKSATRFADLITEPKSAERGSLESATVCSTAMFTPATGAYHRRHVGPAASFADSGRQRPAA